MHARVAPTGSPAVAGNHPAHHLKTCLSGSFHELFNIRQSRRRELNQCSEKAPLRPYSTPDSACYAECMCEAEVLRVYPRRAGVVLRERRAPLRRIRQRLPGAARKGRVVRSGAERRQRAVVALRERPRVVAALGRR